MYGQKIYMCFNGLYFNSISYVQDLMEESQIMQMFQVLHLNMLFEMQFEFQYGYFNSFQDGGRWSFM